MSAESAPLHHRSFLTYWLMLALALLLFAGQTSYELRQSHERIEAGEMTRLDNTCSVLAAELERRLRSINTALLDLRDTAPAMLASREGKKHLTQQITLLGKTIEGVRTLAIFDLTGTIVASNRPELIGSNHGHRPYFKELSDRPQPDRLHMSPPFTTSLGVYTLVLARPIYGSNRKLSGIVTATLDAESLRDLLASLHAGPDTRLSVMHGNGTLLKLMPEQPNVSEHVDDAIKDGSVLGRHIDSGQAGNIMRGISGLTATPSVVAIRTLQPAEVDLDAPFYLTAGRDDASIFASWQLELRLRIVLFIGIAVLTVLALLIYQQHQRSFEQELARKEGERQRSAFALQRFIDHLPGTAYVKDGELRTLMASKGFQVMLGMDPQTMIGKTTAELFPGPFGEKIVADDRRVLESGHTEVIEESFNGRDYESTKFVIDPGTGERWLGGMTVDITARKDAERQAAQHLAHLQLLNDKLEAAQNQLLQSEKMASIGQLAAGVAHELNNPIGFVHSNLGTLERYLKDIFEIATLCEQAAREADNPDDFARIEAIKREKDFDFMRTDIFQLMSESKDGLERVRKIVKDLKDFSRPGETEWQWADLHAGLDSTLNIIWNELKYKCTVTKYYGELPKVHCLLSQLNQVFMNLLVNAAHAIPERGEITITTGQQGNQVFVAIRDTGCGIAQENLNRIFDPFFTTKPVGKGTGLGLSLAWSIVEKHHGRIEVQSEIGHGSTFTVWLPVNPPGSLSGNIQ